MLLYRFRWVFCQLDALQHCFPPNLRQFLNELPETLDETYERILRSINKAQKGNAHRLLQCLTVAARPLRVEELAELLAFDFHGSSSGGIPTLKKDWRWDDQEEAVLSTCSSLITIVRSGDSPVVQFSHFSVKEYLTSPRLARSHGDVSRFHINLERAHTIMAQACLGTLLRLDERADNAEGSPLVEYAAQHWVDHGRFEEVSLRVRDGIDDLFDTTKPHFAAWLHVHDMDEYWGPFTIDSGHGDGSSLYYAALSGIYDLAERLIMKHPEQVNACGGRRLTPLVAALSKRHFHIAKLLRKEGAFPDVRGREGWTLLHSLETDVDIIRWLLDHGADPNIRTLGGSSWTSLHRQIHMRNVEAVQALLEHNAGINLQCAIGRTPLYEALSGTNFSPEEVDIVRRLLAYGADPNIPDNNQSTPLHHVSSNGWLEVVRLLLSYSARVDAKDKGSRTPFQVASAKGYDKVTQLLLEHGAAPEK
jgi:ankyrin repeat protein